MGNEFINIVSTNVTWAGLSVALIFYILRQQEKRDEKSEKRETKYQEIITNITENVATKEDINNMKKDIKEEIKEVKDEISINSKVSRMAR